MPSALGGQAAISFLPEGSMVDFAGTTAPSGWLMCDGAAVSRTVYASLFSSLGVAYGSGDGSTTFNLPDYRGRFARYMDNMGTLAGAAGRDTGRVRGSSQTDATQDHTHDMVARNYAVEAFGWEGYVAGNRFSDTGFNYPNTRGMKTGRAASETRPINLSCNRIIKY